jgi:sugar lactone lactonase YvrE
MRVHSRIPVPFFILCLLRIDVTCAGVDVIDAHARYPEGPLWDQGRLLYVEYAGADIKTWDGKQSKVYWRKDHCGPSGLIHFRGDHILVACYDGNYLAELDAHGKEVGTISKDS